MVDPISIVVLAALALLPAIFGVRYSSRLATSLGIAALVAGSLGTALGFAWHSDTSQSTMITVIPLLLKGVAMIAGIVGLVFAVRARPKPAFTDRAATDHAARVEEIKKWEAAYAAAHGGKAPPEGFSPTVVIAPAAATGPNMFAVLGFVFGVLGGWLGIIFGFIGLSQIKRTGQTGRGLAIAGIVLAFAWVVGSAVAITIALSR